VILALPIPATKATRVMEELRPPTTSLCQVVSPLVTPANGLEFGSFLLRIFLVFGAGFRQEALMSLLPAIKGLSFDFPMAATWGIDPPPSREVLQST
jgi:hypothetical protein